jgi:hypothetical protein
MTDDSGTHFASNEELLSRYALGRLDDAERERIDRHAAGCSTCMASLRREMRIAAGARRLGRDDLKSELKRRIDRESRPARWPRILSAAATVGIVVGLGVYYSWFSERTSVPAQVGADSPVASRTGPLTQVEKKAPAQGIRDKEMAEKTAEPSASSSAQPAAKQKAEAPSTYASAENERRTEYRKMVRSETAPGAAGGETSGGEFWSDGIVEGAVPVPEAAASRGGVAPQEKKQDLAKGNAMKEDEDRLNEEADRLKGAVHRTQGEYLIRQQPASSLPGDRERPGKDQQRVPTRFDQRGNRTTMTMYLDSLVDEKDLKSARVDAVRDDSVVVTLGGKKILYRFPAGQAAQQQRQK